MPLSATLKFDLDKERLEKFEHVLAYINQYSYTKVECIHFSISRLYVQSILHGMI